MDGLKVLRQYGLTVGTLILLVGLSIDAFGPEGRAYALVIGGFGLALAIGAAVADRRRIVAFLTGRQGRAAGASVGYSIVVLAVVVLVNFLAGRHHKRFDLTQDGTFSLSGQTIKILETLPRDVTITAFFRSSEPTRQRLEDLLDEYSYRTDRLTVQFVDPDRSPAAVRSYGVTEYGTIVIESGEREHRVNTGDEESITNALIMVTRDRERAVYFTTGHGERGLEDVERNGLSLLKEALEKQHYTVKPLVLSQGVPGDAAVLVIAGPEKKFLDTEREMVEAYLDRGGRLFLMQDPGDDPGLGTILDRHGVAVRDDVISDKISQLFGGDALVPLVPPDGYDTAHAVTRKFDYQTFYPMASSIEVGDELPEGVTVTKLARTSDYSWGETDQDELRSGKIQMNEGRDLPGPMTVGTAIVRTLDRETAPAADAGDGSTDLDDAVGGGAAAREDRQESRLLLFGDSDFTSNTYFNISGNGDLVLSGIAWLAEQGELVSIRPKTSTPRAVILTSQQAIFYAVTIVALTPIAIVITGVGIWWRRRKL